MLNSSYAIFTRFYPVRNLSVTRIIQEYCISLLAMSTSIEIHLAATYVLHSLRVRNVTRCKLLHAHDGRLKSCVDRFLPPAEFARLSLCTCRLLFVLCINLDEIDRNCYWFQFLQITIKSQSCKMLSGLPSAISHLVTKAGALIQVIL